MLVEHGMDQLHRSRFAQRLGVLVEADEQPVLAHDGLEKGVVGGDFRLEEHGGMPFLIIHDGRRDSRKQFGRGLAREGEAQNLFRRDALFDQVDDSPGHGVGLAGSRTCHHYDVGVRRRLDDGRLFGAVGELAHAALLSKTVFCSSAQAGHMAWYLQYSLCSLVGLA